MCFFSFKDPCSHICLHLSSGTLSIKLYKQEAKKSPSIILSFTLPSQLVVKSVNSGSITNPASPPRFASEPEVLAFYPPRSSHAPLPLPWSRLLPPAWSMQEPPSHLSASTLASGKKVTIKQPQWESGNENHVTALLRTCQCSYCTAIHAKLFSVLLFSSESRFYHVNMEILRPMLKMVCGD